MPTAPAKPTPSVRASIHSLTMISSHSVTDISEFSIYSIAQSPLIVATDIRNMTAIMQTVLLNGDIINIHQVKPVHINIRIDSLKYYPTRTRARLRVTWWVIGAASLSLMLRGRVSSGAARSTVAPHMPRSDDVC